MKDWMRKNPLLKLFRQSLHQYRIEAMTIDMSAEMTDTGAPGVYELPNFKYTGREIVTIRLFGWRRPRGNYPGIIETLPKLGDRKVVNGQPLQRPIIR